MTTLFSQQQLNTLTKQQLRNMLENEQRIHQLIQSNQHPSLKPHLSSSSLDDLTLQKDIARLNAHIAAKKREVNNLKQQVAKQRSTTQRQAEESTQKEGEEGIVKMLQSLQEKKFKIRTSQGKYLACRGKDYMIYSDSTSTTKEELFSIVPLVAFKDSSGKYLSADSNGKGYIVPVEKQPYQF